MLGACRGIGTVFKKIRRDAWVASLQILKCYCSDFISNNGYDFASSLIFIIITA